MISLIESGNLANTENNPMIPRSAELVGLSTDTKPTGVSVGNGWSFIEMDTGKVFFYNAEDEEWLEFAGSGGGGGQGGNNVLIVHVDWDTETLDKTWEEINAADLAVIADTSTENDKYFNVVAQITAESSRYSVVCYQNIGNNAYVKNTFVATSASGYPVFTDDNT